MAEEVFTFEDGNGNKFDFNHIATFDVGNDWYAAFTPVEDNDVLKRDEVIFFRVVEDKDGGQTLEGLKNEAELNRAWRAFQKLLEHDECECEECEHEKSAAKKEKKAASSKSAKTTKKAAKPAAKQTAKKSSK